jgi:predicted site-specific integrase-resolvase
MATVIDVQQPKLLTRQEAAARYRISLRTLDRFVREGRLVKVVLGPRMTRLNPEQCDEALLQFTVKGNGREHD